MLTLKEAYKRVRDLRDRAEDKFTYFNKKEQKIEILDYYDSRRLDDAEARIEERREHQPGDMAQFDQYLKFKLFFLSTPTHRGHVETRLIEYLQRIADILDISALKSVPGDGRTVALREIAPAPAESSTHRSSDAPHHEQRFQASGSRTVQRSHHANTARGPSDPQHHSDAMSEVQGQEIMSIPCALETSESTCRSYKNPLSLQVHIA